MSQWGSQLQKWGSLSLGCSPWGLAWCLMLPQPTVRVQGQVSTPWVPVRINLHMLLISLLTALSAAPLNTGLLWMSLLPQQLWLWFPPGLTTQPRMFPISFRNREQSKSLVTQKCVQFSFSIWLFFGEIRAALIGGLTSVVLLIQSVLLLILGCKACFCGDAGREKWEKQERDDSRVTIASRSLRGKVQGQEAVLALDGRERSRAAEESHDRLPAEWNPDLWGH